MLAGIRQEISLLTVLNPPHLRKTGRSSYVVKVRSAGAEGLGEECSSKLADIRREDATRDVRSFVKPLSQLYPRLPCRFCGGLGAIVCDICEGDGKFARGGYHKKNPVSLERIVGSKWTAMERTFGWRHFRVQSKRRGTGKDWFVEMCATCDETTRFWVNSKNLKERERWSMGWLQKVEILAASDKDAASNLVCKACKGKGRQPCVCSLRHPEETVLDIIEV